MSIEHVYAKFCAKAYNCLVDSSYVGHILGAGPPTDEYLLL